MSALVAQVEKATLAGNLICRGEGVLVAVSGGIDSMTLLEVLHAFSARRNWRIVVGHFNHQLRGASSDADERLVRKRAKELGLRVRVGRGDARAYAKRHGISVEMAARFLRHQFLARAAVALGMRKVALAHHADDQVELFFLRLARGAGVEGLCGMKARRPSPFDKRVELIRPLLEVRRREIEKYARAERIRFRQDSSNAKLEHERNRVRHRVLPVLRRQLGAQFEAKVLRFVEVLREESALVGEVTREALMNRPGTFNDLHPAVQRRWLVSQCAELGIPADYELIENLRLNEGHCLTVPGGRVVWRTAAGHIEARKVSPVRVVGCEKRVDLTEGCGSVQYGTLTLTWRVVPWCRSGRTPSKQEPGMERFDADKVGSAVRLRHWKAGDRFQPIGMPAPVKLQDLFTNTKVPRDQRRERVVAQAATGEIFWVEGLRISEGYKIRPETVRCLAWSWAKIDAISALTQPAKSTLLTRPESCPHAE